MEFKPSPFQQAVYDNIESGTSSLSVIAVAGSGKTTTIVEAVKLLPTNKRIMFCAFNKSIATELAEKLPKHVNTCTLNALGHRAWMRHAGKIQLKTSKTFDILDSKEITKDYETRELRSVRFIANKLVNLAKQAGIVPNGMKGVTGLVEDTDNVWLDLIDHFNIEMNIDRNQRDYAELAAKKSKLAIEVTRKALAISIKQTNVIDFADQLFLPVIYNANFAKNDVVFVDEAQDISAIQRVMLKRSLDAKTGRLVAVGDPCQAIYGFRGADSESLNNIISDFNAKTLPLSISYRCSKKVVEEAQKYVEHIQAFEDAPEGEVADLGEYDPSDLDVFQPNDFVLCRNVAPLVRLAFTLIAGQKPVAILGRDIGATIAALIKKLNAVDLGDLKVKLDDWERTETTRVLERDPEANVGYIAERADAVRTFIDCADTDTIDGVLKAIERLFSDKAENVVLLSTVHKSKGLEAERVIILDEQLMPSKYAVKPWMKIQENNLMYVAITRSINFLGYITSPMKIVKPAEEL